VCLDHIFDTGQLHSWPEVLENKDIDTLLRLILNVFSEKAAPSLFKILSKLQLCGPALKDITMHINLIIIKSGTLVSISNERSRADPCAQKKGQPTDTAHT